MIVDVDFNGQSYEHESIFVDYTDGKFVRYNDGVIADLFSLKQNYPNPFNNSTTIEFNIPRYMAGNKIELIIYNDLGRRIKSIFSGNLAEGKYLIQWDGKNNNNQFVTSGFYYLILSSETEKILRKMTLVK